MSVLWVTSFDKKIYDVSGKQLIESFEKFKPYGKLFIGFEGDNSEVPDIFSNQTVKFGIQDSTIGNGNFELKYDLHKTIFAERWISENLDIIPVDRGGKMVPCGCPQPMAKQERMHKPGCYHTWFNRNTYRFVNKIFTLQLAWEYVNKSAKYDYIIWVDADCQFTKYIDSAFIEETIFNDCKADLAILRGPRDFLEAGLVGYNLSTREGFDLLGKYIDIYLNQEFRKELIWDDCHILEAIIAKERPQVHDLARDVGRHNDVFSKSLIKDHITHDKGRHGRKLGIFK